jgi:hypothetical protein
LKKKRKKKTIPRIRAEKVNFSRAVTLGDDLVPVAGHILYSCEGSAAVVIPFDFISFSLLCQLSVDSIQPPREGRLSSFMMVIWTARWRSSSVLSMQQHEAPADKK